MTQHSKFSEAALKREDRSQKDLSIQLIDYSELVAFREPTRGELYFSQVEQIIINAS
jgi:type I restriction enzyme R subunit